MPCYPFKTHLTYSAKDNAEVHKAFFKGGEGGGGGGNGELRFFLLCCIRRETLRMGICPNPLVLDCSIRNVADVRLLPVHSLFCEGSPS